MSEKKKETAKGRTWDDLKRERFKKDPNEAVEYLRAAIEENSDVPDLVIEAIRSVSESLDMSLGDVAKKAKLHKSTIHKALGKHGNPTLGTLSAVLKAMGLKITIERAS